MSKPAVVKNKEVTAKGFRFLGYSHKLVSIEVEIGGFPVIEKNWVLEASPSLSRYVLPYKPAVLYRQIPQSILRVGKDKERKSQRLSFSKAVGEIFASRT